jgi:hypothetical protein
MDLNDYCIKSNAFMTLSIYMANLFDDQNPDKLSTSIYFNEIQEVPRILVGTTKCIKFAGKSSQFGFCFETIDIAVQIINAYTKFYQCTKNEGSLPLIDTLLESCDISKIDFTEKGPFGLDGPKYLAKIQEKNKNKSFGYGNVDKSLIYNPLNLNKYYSLSRAPGTN